MARFVRQSKAISHGISTSYTQIRPHLFRNFGLNQREALYRYLDDGWLKPDNNTAENAIRHLALGRKNWLFAGSERGGKGGSFFQISGSLRQNTPMV